MSCLDFSHGWLYKWRICIACRYAWVVASNERPTWLGVTKEKTHNGFRDAHDQLNVLWFINFVVSAELEEPCAGGLYRIPGEPSRAANIALAPELV
jgi:hypothetical protein